MVPESPRLNQEPDLPVFHMRPTPSISPGGGVSGNSQDLFYKTQPVVKELKFNYSLLVLLRA